MSFWTENFFQKTNDIISRFLPWNFFCSFLGASWKLYGLPGDIVSNIIHKEAYRKPQKASRKPQGSYKKFQGRNPEIISLVFWKKFSDQKDILKLTDLYLLNFQEWFLFKSEISWTRFGVFLFTSGDILICNALYISMHYAKTVWSLLGISNVRVCEYAEGPSKRSTYHKKSTTFP